MRRMFYCYERNQVDRHWQPVVHYDEMPGKSTQSKESNAERYPEAGWPVPLDCLGDHDEPLFGALERRFAPPPKDAKV